MSCWKSTCRALVVMSTMGLITQPVLHAQQIQPASQASPVNVRDIALDGAGVFRGAVLDTQGQPAVGIPVKIRQGDAPIAETTTDANGRFTVASLRGGFYRIDAGRQADNVRVWSPNTAPPKATDAFTIVVGQVTRGQDGCTGSCTGSCTTCGGGFGGGFGGGPLGFLMNPLVIGAAVAAAIAIPLAVDDDDDAPAS